MRFERTPLPGVLLVRPDRVADERGWFSRVYDADEFGRAGVGTRWHSTAVSYNARALTLRGMHLQLEPHAEAKLVRCTRGRMFDVAVDLRPDSPTLHQWWGVELSDADALSVLLPEGVAHGFLTLEPDTEVHYHLSAAFAPDAASGLRWDDPVIGIEWPAEPLVVSDRDRALPLLDAAAR